VLKKIANKNLFYCLLLPLFLSGCSLAPDVQNILIDKKSDFDIPRPPKSKTVRINNIDFKQIFYPIGKFGGTLNLTTFGSGPKTFNLWASTDNTSSTLGRLMFDGLFDDDPDSGEVIPHLAKGYEILDDGKTINVKLREGMKWSDGEPITSDDVVFTWNEIIFTGLEGGGFQSLCLIDGKYPTVKKIDDHAVQFMTHVVFILLHQNTYLNQCLIKQARIRKEFFFLSGGPIQTLLIL
jgi:ABC-type transport system substrate-binding protein